MSVGSLGRDTGEGSASSELLGYREFLVRVLEGEDRLWLMIPFFFSSRVRRAPLVQLVEMGCRVLWGFLVLRDPPVWQERMETRCGNLQTLGPIFPDEIADLRMPPIPIPVFPSLPHLGLFSNTPSALSP